MQRRPSRFRVHGVTIKAAFSESSIKAAHPDSNPDSKPERHDRSVIKTSTGLALTPRQT
jgi:hypothetical protein